MGTVRISETNSNPSVTFQVEGDLVSQSVAGNYSVVRCYLVAKNSGNTSSRWLGAGSQSGTIAGVKTFATKSGNPFLPGGYANGATRWRLGPYDVQVPHNPDGTREPIKFGMVLDYAVQETVFSDEMSLPTIARATPVTWSPNPADAGSAIAVDLSDRASSSFTHDLVFGFGDLAYEPIANGVGTSYNWTPPLSMLSQIPNSTEAPLTIGAYTKNGAATVGYRSATGKLRAPAFVVPTAGPLEVTDQNPDVASIVGKMVQGLSIARFSVGGAGVYGSTVTKREVTFQGKTSSAGTDSPVTLAGNVTATGKVTDSRGRSKTVAGTVEVLPYSPPVATAYQARRCDALGQVFEDGTYLRLDLTAAISSLMNGTQRNELTIRAFTRPRVPAGQPLQPWSARNVITNGGLTYNSWFLMTGGGIFSPTGSWDVRVQVHDKFGVYVADTVVSTATVALDLNGTNVGVGKIWEQGAFDVAGQIYQGGQPVLDASDLVSATTSRTGVVELATDAETVSGTDASRATTPASVRAAMNAYETPWTNVTTFGSGWASAPGYTLQVRRQGSRVDVRGALSITSGSFANMFTVPAPFAPNGSRFLGAALGNNGTLVAQLRIQSSGVVDVPSGYRVGALASGGAIAIAGFWHID